jgi:hypothetical protein
MMALSYFPAIGFEGQIADTSIRVIRGALENWVTGDAPVPFGRGVIRLPSGRISLPTATGQKIIGISVATDIFGSTYSAGKLVDPAYPPNSCINIITMGDILVWSETACNPDDSLFVRLVAGTAPLDVVGRFANATGTGLEALPGCKALKKTTVAGLVPVFYNSSVPAPTPSL